MGVKIAVLDLGSTSFHLSVVEARRDGSMERLLRRRETLHLSAAVARHGHLPDDLCDTAVRAVRLLRRAADDASPDMILAVATSALRDAANGGGLIPRLEVAARCQIRVLTGHEEARLAYRAVRESTKLGGGPLLVADLGGGSLDVALGIRDELIDDATFPLGASLLHASFVENDPPSQRECDAIVTHVREQITSFAPSLTGIGPIAAAASGGTARALGRLHAARAGLHPATGRSVVVPTASLFSMTSLLTGLARNERLELPAVRARRVDVLPVGALVLSTLVESLDIGGLAMCEWGLREGVILEALEQLPARASA